MMNRLLISISLLLVAGVFFSSCDDIFNSKDNSDTNEIFEEGRIDPTLENLDGYAPVQPFWEALMLQKMYMLDLMSLYM